MGGWTLGVTQGIPVRLHWSLLLLLPLLLPDLGWFTLPLLAVFMTAVLLHELGHSVVAQACGLRVEQILLTPLGGVALIRAADLSPADEMRIAVAGPLVSLALALAGGAAVLVFHLLAWPDAAWYTQVLLVAPNASLFLFNLLPAFPMDGGRMLRAALTPGRGRLEATRLASSLGRGLALAFGAVALLFWHDLRLAVLAAFIYLLAGAEWRTVRRRHAIQTFPFPPGPTAWGAADPEEWVVSPPPYARPQSRTLWREVGAAAQILAWRLAWGRRPPPRN
jgi:Zn-dependent protease